MKGIKSSRIQQDLKKEEKSPLNLLGLLGDLFRKVKGVDGTEPLLGKD